MEAYRTDTAEAVQYAHFEDDFIRTAYLNASDMLLDYQIERVEKINDQLFGFTILIKTTQTMLYAGEDYEKVYNFVGQIDGEWYFMNGVANIPAELQENLDVSQYTYDDENIVPPEGVFEITAE